VLRSGKYVGTFASKVEAEEAALRQAARSRAFGDFQVWKGTPRNPIEPDGNIYPGIADLAQ
jgi:hypothetical protein